MPSANFSAFRMAKTQLESFFAIKFFALSISFSIAFSKTDVFKLEISDSILSASVSLPFDLNSLTIYSTIIIIFAASSYSPRENKSLTALTLSKIDVPILKYC